jgi:hypothetical protein
MKIASNGRPEPPPARGSQKARTMDFNGTSTLHSTSSSTINHQQGGSTASQTPPARKLIVPAFPTHAAQTQNFDGSLDALNDLKRNTSSASTRSLPSRPAQQQPGAFSTQPQNHGPQVLRKPAAPPIPNKKPALLSKNSYPAPQQQQYRDDPTPKLPPPRRSVAERRPVHDAHLMDTDERPPLPPRNGADASNGSGRGGARNLMDDESEEMRGLDGWEVLRPVR